MNGACLEDEPRIDNKSCGETDTTEWKKKPCLQKIDEIQTVKEDLERSYQLGEDTWVGSRQKNLEGADRPVC